MEFLNFRNEERSTLCGREFHTFTTLSVSVFYTGTASCQVFFRWMQSTY